MAERDGIYLVNAIFREDDKYFPQGKKLDGSPAARVSAGCPSMSNYILMTITTIPQNFSGIFTVYMVPGI